MAPFTDHVKDRTTVLLPVVQNAADLNALTAPYFESVYIGTKKPEDLTELNNQVNKLYEITAK